MGCVSVRNGVRGSRGRCRSRPPVEYVKQWTVAFRQGACVATSRALLHRSSLLLRRQRRSQRRRLVGSSLKKTQRCLAVRPGTGLYCYIGKQHLRGSRGSCTSRATVEYTRGCYVSKGTCLLPKGRSGQSRAWRRINGVFASVRDVSRLERGVGAVEHGAALAHRFAHCSHRRGHLGGQRALTVGVGRVHGGNGICVEGNHALTQTQALLGQRGSTCVCVTRAGVAIAIGASASDKGVVALEKGVFALEKGLGVLTGGESGVRPGRGGAPLRGIGKGRESGGMGCGGLWGDDCALHLRGSEQGGERRARDGLWVAGACTWADSRALTQQLILEGGGMQRACLREKGVLAL